MRLMLELIATKSCAYDFKYHNKIQGFIYSLLKDTCYKHLHDKKGYKYFCFSNIFPVPKDRKIKENQEMKLIISSPDKNFITVLEERVKELQQFRKPINIGEMQFLINEIKKFELKLRAPLTIKTSTPVIIRIPDYMYEEYEVPLHLRKKRYTYWQPGIDFTAFVKQLEDNILKKYNTYYNTKIETNIFEVFEFIDTVPTNVIIGNEEYVFKGSLWKFRFSYLSPMHKKLLEFAIDCGFGERNSYGFGFVNVEENGALKITRY